MYSAITSILFSEKFKNSLKKDNVEKWNNDGKGPNWVLITYSMLSPLTIIKKKQQNKPTPQSNTYFTVS